MLKNFGITTNVSTAEKCALMNHLVTRSSANTAAAIANGTSRGFILFAQDFAYRALTGFAQRWEFLVSSNLRSVLPAALAFVALGALNRNGHPFACSGFEHNLRNDENSRQLVLVFAEQRI